MAAKYIDLSQKYDRNRVVTTKNLKNEVPMKLLMLLIIVYSFQTTFSQTNRDIQFITDILESGLVKEQCLKWEKAGNEVTIAEILFQKEIIRIEIFRGTLNCIFFKIRKVGMSISSDSVESFADYKFDGVIDFGTSLYQEKQIPPKKRNDGSIEYFVALYQGALMKVKIALSEENKAAMQW